METLTMPVALPVPPNTSTLTADRDVVLGPAHKSLPAAFWGRTVG